MSICAEVERIRNSDIVCYDTQHVTSTTKSPTRHGAL